MRPSSSLALWIALFRQRRQQQAPPDTDSTLPVDRLEAYAAQLRAEGYNVGYAAGFGDGYSEAADKYRAATGRPFWAPLSLFRQRRQQAQHGVLVRPGTPAQHAGLRRPDLDVED